MFRPNNILQHTCKVIWVPFNLFNHHLHILDRGLRNSRMSNDFLFNRVLLFWDSFSPSEWNQFFNLDLTFLLSPFHRLQHSLGSPDIILSKRNSWPASPKIQGHLYQSRVECIFNVQHLHDASCLGVRNACFRVGKRPTERPQNR